MQDIEWVDARLNIWNIRNEKKANKTNKNKRFAIKYESFKKALT